MKKIFSVFTVLSFALLLILPVFSWAFVSNNAFALAPSEILKTVLASDVDNSYAGENFSSPSVSENFYALDGFTPFENEEQRKSGNAVFFDSGLVVNFAAVEDVTLHNLSEYSLFMYVFVPTVNFEKFIVSIYSSDADSDGYADSAISWTIKKDNLISADEEYLVLPGWKKIELPLSTAVPTLNGFEGDPVYLSALDKISFKFTGTTERFGVYDVYFSENSFDSSNLEKNNILLYSSGIDRLYYLVATKGNYENVVAGILKNDVVKIPGYSDVFDYAWVGGQKIQSISGTLDGGAYYQTPSGAVKTSESIDYKFAMKLTSPSGAFSYYDFGQVTTDRFSQNGTYYFQLVCLGEISEDNWVEFASATIKSVVITEKVDALRFDTTANTISTGYTYKYNFSVNINYWRCLGDVKITSSNQKILKIVNVIYDGNGSGYVEVEGLKGGKADLVLSAKLVRTDGSSSKNETTSITINVNSTDDESSKTIKIVLICALSVTVAGGIAYAIVEIVKHNKMQVK